MNQKKKFFVGILALTSVVAVAIFSGQQFGWFPIHPYIWLILLYNVLLTVVSFLMVNGAKSGDGFDFYNRFMGNFAVRMLLTATLILIYFYKVKVENMNFVFTFFTFYFIYTIFEIKHLLANLRQNSESVENQHEK